MISDVEVRDAGSKGRGVYARRAFRAGDFIFRRRHTRVLTTAELDGASDWERIRLNAFDGSSWPCECGAAICTGTVVGSFFAMDPDRQELLLPHAPAFIRREYLQRRRDGP